MRSVLSRSIGVAAAIAFAMSTGAASAHAATTDVTAPAGATTTPGIAATVGHSLELSAQDFTRPGGTHPGAYFVFGKLNWFPSVGGSGAWAEYVPGANSQLFVSWAGSPTAPFANGLFDDDPAPAFGDFAFSSGANNSTPGLINKRLNVAAKFVSQTGSTIDCTLVACGVISFGAHGQANAGSESFKRVYFNGTPTSTLDPNNPGTVSTPTLTVPGSVDNDDGTFNVTGEFDNYNANWSQGFYLSFGTLDADWKPSEGYPAAARDAVHTFWVHPGGSAGPTTAKLESDGTFTVDFPITNAETAGSAWTSSSQGYAVWAVPAHGTFPGLEAWEAAEGLAVTN